MAVISSITEKPLISIITVVLNGENYLERCILSVKEQDFKNYEHILIDGGSTDKTLEIAKQYKNHFTHIISEPDEGISDAFNKGIKMSLGKIVGLLNADDFYTREALNLVAAEMGDNDILYSPIIRYNEKKQTSISEANHNQLLSGMTIYHPSCFIKKKVYEKFGYYNTDFHFAMDYELLLRMKLGGATFKYINTPLTAIQEGGRSYKGFFKGLKEVKKAKEIHLGHSLKNEALLYKQASVILLVKFLSFLGIYNYLKKLQ